MMDLELPKVTGRFFGGTFPANRVLCDLSNRARRALSNISEQTYFAKDSNVIAERQIPGIYVHQRGRAETIYFNSLNRRFIFQSVDPDEMFGLVETLSDIPFRMTVKAITPCLFQTIEKQAFTRFLLENPRVSYRLVKLLGDDICTSSLFFSNASFPDNLSSCRNAM